MNTATTNSHPVRTNRVAVCCLSSMRCSWKPQLLPRRWSSRRAVLSTGVSGDLIDGDGPPVSRTEFERLTSPGDHRGGVVISLFDQIAVVLPLSGAEDLNSKIDTFAAVLRVEVVEFQRDSCDDIGNTAVAGSETDLQTIFRPSSSMFSQPKCATRCRVTCLVTR